jgi:hypothetical protein
MPHNDVRFDFGVGGGVPFEKGEPLFSYRCRPEVLEVVVVNAFLWNREKNQSEQQRHKKKTTIVRG